MRRGVSLKSVVILLALAAACGGGPEPEPEPAPPPPPPPAETDDAAAREAEAQRLCERARAALEAGNYDTARELFRQAETQYAGTACAESAGDEIARVDAIEAIRERIHFEFDRSAITDEAAAVLQRKAEVLRRYPDLALVIEGHCDERGSLEYNQALGMRRSESARRFLASQEVNTDAFRTVSFGEEQPLVNQSNESAWAMNRRAEFVITEWGSLGN